MARKKKPKRRLHRLLREPTVLDKPKDPTITQRDKRYRQGRKAAGFVPVRVFVPATEVQKVRDLAKKLRKQHARSKAAASDNGVTVPGRQE